MSGFAGTGAGGGGSGTLVQYATDSGNIDAFGRLRVSNNHILLSSQQNFDTLPLVWGTALTGGGTVNYINDESSTELLLTAANGDKVIRQTKRYWIYRAGQSQTIALTFADGYQVANRRKRVGYFDDNNGIFLEITGTEVAVVQRSSTSGSPVDTRVLQADWSVDSLNGSGASGIALDLTKAQIFHIDYQWLGVGSVRVGFNIGGQLFYAHEFENSNALPTVYMRTGSLPVRYEFENTAAATGVAGFKQICSAVYREGGSEEEGVLTAADTGFNISTATTALRSALSVRLNSTHSRAFLVPQDLFLFNRGTEAIRWQVILNPTLTGSLTWTALGQASQQSTTQLVYTAGTGHRIAAGYVDSSSASKFGERVGIRSILGIAANIAGTSDILTIVVEAFTTTHNCDMSLQFLELY